MWVCRGRVGVCLYGDSFPTPMAAEEMSCELRMQESSIWHMCVRRVHRGHRRVCLRGQDEWGWLEKGGVWDELGEAGWRG